MTDQTINNAMIAALRDKAQGWRAIYQHKDGSIRVTECYTYAVLDELREDYRKAGHTFIRIITDERYQELRSQK